MVASELRQLVPLVEPDAVPAVTAGLVAMGAVDGPVGVRRLRPAMLARYGLGDLLQDVEDRHRGLTVLSCGHDIGGGITEYRLRLNPEARAVVEAAVNALTKPVVVDGVRDPRTDPGSNIGPQRTDHLSREVGRQTLTPVAPFGTCAAAWLPARPVFRPCPRGRSEPMPDTPLINEVERRT